MKLRKRKRIEDYTHNSDDDTDPTVKKSKFRSIFFKVCEVLFAATISSAIHTVTFENGWRDEVEGNYNNPQFDYFNYFFRKLLLSGENSNNVSLLYTRLDKI